MKSTYAAWIGLVVVNALLWVVVGAPADADSRRTSTPPANPAAQRGQMVIELTEIKQLLREQNHLLRSGKVRVIVAE